MVRSSLLPVIALLGACGRLGFDATGTTDAPPTGPLIAHYRMDDDPADGAEDASEYHHDALCTTCPSQLSARGGGVFEFDGATTYLEAPYASAFATTSGVTASAWIKVAAQHAETRCIVGKPVGVGDNNSWQLCVGDSLQLVVCVGHASSPPSSTCERSALGSVALGTFHHVALTYDGAVMRAWLDGTRVIEMPEVSGLDDRPVLIGADIDNGGLIGFFDGLIDEVRIYNQALPEADVLALAAP